MATSGGAEEANINSGLMVHGAGIIIATGIKLSPSDVKVDAICWPGVGLTEINILRIGD
jgi:hypothetical protein